jgi:glycosyltransferase involved in cell wall biosynthesis
MNVLRHIDRDKFQVDFLVHKEDKGSYDEEIRAIGGQIYYCADPKNLGRYAAKFSDIVARNGPFDVIHSHVYWSSGYILRLAHRAGIPIRIAHSHTATEATGRNVPRRFYQHLMRSWIAQHGTHRIASSRQAAEALFGKRAAQILYYGLDFTSFRDLECRERVKHRLGVPDGRLVVGHVGRFVPVKNHTFMIDILERLIAEGTDAHLMLVGDGPLLSTIKAQVEARGLSDRCTFTGEQSQVAPFFSAMDVFVLPSHYEGLGIVAVESQAAGVPLVVSTGVPKEVDVISGLIEHVPLSAGPSVWASAVKHRLKRNLHRSGNEAVLLERSKFGLPTCLEALSTIYQSSLN